MILASTNPTVYKNRTVDDLVTEIEQQQHFWVE